ncbi:hypothetical protein [Nocardia terpenica]|uniref:Uncharacterized protein n=1 Tax=Nocardia terpenica TaxID=455432 RepID=A0A6G9YVI7_9NOCA|nr:hypothetical protein [Nocardia terpenica]QIS17355.1 hypothetical protein F6W96_02550 [Nocardia terpenica]
MARITLSPTRSRPASVSLAFQAVVAALLCGITETVVHLAVALDSAHPDLSGLGRQVAVRAAIYGVVFAVALRMAAGRRWARTLLAVGLGTAGLASLLVEPLTALATHGFGEVGAGLTPAAGLTALLRTGHVVAVLVMLAALGRADARRYFGGVLSPRMWRRVRWCRRR